MPNITLAVYFSGTSHRIADHSMLASHLFFETKKDAYTQKMGFNGCGVDYGWKGGLFGSGLELQCEQVFAKILKELKNGNRIKLIAYGHSRGAIACLLLAKMLGKFDRDLVEVNLALMDPVSGNFVASSTLDVAGFTLARQTMDLRECRNLMQVLAIYPHEPLPAILAHAPVIPLYPTHCQVTEEIIPGCHAGAQFMRFNRIENRVSGNNEESTITYHLITRFLIKLGIRFKFLNSSPSADEEKAQNKELLNLYDVKWAQIPREEMSRSCHAKFPVTIKTQLPATYLSPLHEQLQNSSGSMPSTNYAQRYAFTFSATKRPIYQPSIILVSLEDRCPLLAEFLAEICTFGMSTKSLQSTKGLLLKECAAKLQDAAQFTNDNILKDTMRNALALCLQRDRNSFSLYSTTRSGYAAIKLLNSDKFKILAQMISNTEDQKICYRDLRGYILGKNDESYFNASKAKTLYQYFQPANPASPRDLESDQPEKLLANNMSFYLSR
jgi:hypothetical protein